MSKQDVQYYAGYIWDTCNILLSKAYADKIQDKQVLDMIRRMKYNAEKLMGTVNYGQ